MMMTIQKSPISLKKLFVIAAAAVCSLTSCQEDELTNVSNTAVEAAEQVEVSLQIRSVGSNG